MRLLMLWKLSGRVSPFVLSFVQNSFSCLIKDFRSSPSFLVFKPVISWRPFHYPTFRLFQLFGNFFNWQTSRSKYRRLGSQLADLFSINSVHLSWYSQNRGKIVSNSGHKIRNIWRKNINARAHIWRENAKIEYSNKKMAQKIHDTLSDWNKQLLHKWFVSRVQS